MEECLRKMAEAEQQMEERLAKKFGSMIEVLASSIERVEAKVDTLAPLVQSLSLAQLDLGAKVDTLAPLVQSISLAQLDARQDLEQLEETIGELQHPEDLQLSYVGDAMATLDADLKALQKKVDRQLSPMLQSFALAQMDNLASMQDTQATLEELGADAQAVSTKLATRDQADAELKVQMASLEVAVQELLVQKTTVTDASIQTAHCKEASSQTTTQMEAASPSNRIPACLLDASPSEDVCDSPYGAGFASLEQAFNSSGSGSKKALFSKQARSPDKLAKRAARGEKLHSTEWSEHPMAVIQPGSTIGLRALERGFGGSRSLPFLPPMF